MNYISSNYSNATYFYPDNSGGVGKFIKSPLAQTMVTFDYSNVLTTATLKSISFMLDVQTNPLLIVSGLQIVGASKIASWIISGGWGGITYNLSVHATLSDSTVRTDVVTVEITGDDAMGCCNPAGNPMGMTPIPAGYQQAGLAQNGVYASGLIRYFVSNVAPLGANVMDQWYDTSSSALLEYITDGVHSYWYNPSNPISPSGVSNSLYYPATSGQKIFHSTLPDASGQTYLMTPSTLVAVYVNGILFTPNIGAIGDYTLDVTTSTVTLNKGLVANDILTLRIAEG